MVNLGFSPVFGFRAGVRSVVRAFFRVHVSSRNRES